MKDASSTPPTVPLALVAPGRPVRLERLACGQGLQRRLAAMGLVAGVLIEVISGSPSGPIVVALNQSRIMLGRGVAHGLRVSECSSRSSPFLRDEFDTSNYQG
ncbi:MAG TPA: FeoA family protein [Candidatus Hydrogenedentes bacterium]|nr:FeoA family protein [Candidatus Hydrogenedentota bacterium]